MEVRPDSDNDLIVTGLVEQIEGCSEKSLEILIVAAIDFYVRVMTEAKRRREPNSEREGEGENWRDPTIN